MLPQLYKILAVILVQRLQQVIKGTIRNCQNGFQPQRDCCDNLYILRVVLDDVINTERAAICVFVDFRKVDRSLYGWRGCLWGLCACRLDR